MKKINKKLMMAIAKDFMSCNEKDLKVNGYCYHCDTRGTFGGKQTVDFDLMTFSYTNFSGEKVCRNILKDVGDIVKKLADIKKLVDKNAFKEYFDMMYSNCCGAVVGVDEYVKWYYLDVLKERLIKEGFNKDDIESAASDANELAEQRMYEGRCYMDYDDVFEEDYKTAYGNRIGKDFDGDTLLLNNDYAYVPEI